MKKHPWLDLPPDSPYAYPGFTLSNEQQFVNSDEEWAGRDVVEIFGTLQGASRLAQLFLDLSRPGNPTREVDLEIEGGFRGVCPLSSEARFWLPGGFDWRPEWFET